MALEHEEITREIIGAAFEVYRIVVQASRLHHNSH